jgi:hypothetical protein
MHTVIYAMTRLILFGFGWAVAGLMSVAADFMMTGMRWPVFSVFAAWWTYVCAVYVQSEADNSATRSAGPNGMQRLD